ncbi:AraC family transcriptional regulator [Paenibacillus sp. 79R4]|uniref:helix-turn-helix domain-containing protein n=1 Tax=Paenibacillus sp. 79R4 TaxID=2212847 RepID=UPI0015BCD751|nr:helix-turn-helix domain-containing protein [Paenibacillus sp. 79R4]NWL87131.1 AraC family transcriptional regulator [Paenibacillus sp. 79R4]
MQPLSCEEVNYICQHLHQAHGLSVFYVSEGEFKAEYVAGNMQRSPYYLPLKDRIKGCLSQQQSDCPIFFTLSYLQFFYINLENQAQAAAKIVVGPCLKSELDSTNVDIINELSQQGFTNIRLLIEFYQSFPAVGYEHLLSISLLAYYMLYQVQLQPSFVVKMSHDVIPEMEPKTEPDLEISSGRRNLIFHSNLYYERVLLDYVRRGRLDKIRDLSHSTIIGEKELGTLSRRSQLRSEKNIMIIGIALICRAAIEGGLNEETALTLNDFYIQQLEEEEQISGINAVMEEAVTEFTHRVANLNEQRYSAPIQACQHYISDHLYEDITLEQLSGLSFLSPNYLSSLFKNKVDISLSEYIQQERIHEAMKLLTLTPYPISDICAWLNFHDQSYFIKVFKKFTGMTPKQYRNAEQPSHEF